METIPNTIKGIIIKAKVAKFSFLSVENLSLMIGIISPFVKLAKNSGCLDMQSSSNFTSNLLIFPWFGDYEPFSVKGTKFELIFESKSLLKLVRDIMNVVKKSTKTIIISK